MEPIILIGGGGHCVSCIDVIEQTGLYQIMGILDLPEKSGERIIDYTVIGTDDDIEQLTKKCPNFLITVGQIYSPSIREKIYHRVIKAGGKLPVIISPLAYVSKKSTINQGSIIMHNAIINIGSRIGLCSIINSKSLIEHEANIGDFCHISTASVINGQVSVGDRCFIGSNSVVANNVIIVSDTIISAGSQVLKSIEIKGTYIGQPLRKIR